MGFSGHLGELEAGWESTEFSCATCGEAVQFAEETFVVTVVLAQMTEGGMSYAPLIFEDGDFLYEPNYLCAHCWEQSKDELEELVRDTPEVEDHHSILSCHICRSGIRTGEVIGLATEGEVRLSRRAPNGEHGGSTFECTSDDPTVLCISCLNKLSAHVVDELWNESVRQFHECQEGTEIRCWRNGCSAEEDSACANCNSCTAQTG